jgi:hypothetical protein
MGVTTFSGPIKAGDISHTTGTTVGSNVANVGFVTMAQSSAIDIIGADAVTTVAVIPANSQIVDIILDVTVVSNDTGTATVSIGKTGSAALFLAATSVKATGRTRISVAATLAAAWDIGTSDIDIIATFDGENADGTTGTAFVTVLYVQSKNNV